MEGQDSEEAFVVSPVQALSQTRTQASPGADVTSPGEMSESVLPSVNQESGTFYEEVVEFDATVSSPKKLKLFEELPKEYAPFKCGLCDKQTQPSEIRFICAECPDDLGMCAQCFCNGRELGNHKASHSYRVCPNLAAFRIDEQAYQDKGLRSQNPGKAVLASAITAGDSPLWSLEDEALLLEGISLYGVGNWSGVSNHLGSKTPEQCEERFTNVYIFRAMDVDKYEPTEAEIAERERIKRKLLELQKKAPHMPGADLAGFMPLRKEFDVEYLNDAELLIADMKFDEEETEELKMKKESKKNLGPKRMRELKLNTLRSYNMKLDEREKRKVFAIKHGLLDWKTRKARLRQETTEQKGARAALEPFIRFMEPDEYEMLVYGLSREQAIKAEIERLRKFRSQGFTTLKQINQYERDSKQEKKRQRQRFHDNYFFPGLPSFSRGTGRNSRSSRKRRKRRSAGVDYSEASDGEAEEKDPEDSSIIQSEFEFDDEEDSVNNQSHEANGQMNEKIRGTVSDALIDSTPGPKHLNEQGLLLAQKEKILCEILDINAKQYFQIKSMVLKECYEKGIIQRPNATSELPAQQSDEKPSTTPQTPPPRTPVNSFLTPSMSVPSQPPSPPSAFIGHGRPSDGSSAQRVHDDAQLVSVDISKRRHNGMTYVDFFVTSHWAPPLVPSELFMKNQE